MKRCQFCAEEIQVATIKCPYCGRASDTSPAGEPTAYAKRFQTITESDATVLGEGTLVELRPGGYISQRAEQLLADKHVRVVRLTAAADLGGEPASDQPVVTRPVSPLARRSRWPAGFLIVIALGVLLVAGLNYFLVARVVAEKLDSDARNSGFAMSAHYRFFVDMNTLVLDLRRVDAAAPIDLFRGLFAAADGLTASGRQFDLVILARAGEPVFLMKGENFAALGKEVAGGENPVFMIRTLPETLHLPSGEAAFGVWSGGFLGVMNKQMEDVNTAARKWADGR